MLNTKYKILNIHTDGGARGNPGPAGIGVICRSSDGNRSATESSSQVERVFQLSHHIGVATNNVAEYTAVIKALEYLRDKKISAQKIQFILDSELVVKQLKGQYKIKQPHLQKLAIKIKTLLADHDNLSTIIQFSHVKREFNKEADKLVNQAIDSISEK